MFNLEVTRFSVTPLNEESGIIEWVGNTQSFRSLIQETYARDGQPYRYREMLNHDPRKHPDPVTFFLNEAIPKYTFELMLDIYIYCAFHIDFL